MRRTTERHTTASDRIAQLSGEVQSLQKCLAELTDVVSRNDAILKKTQERELELLRAGSLAQLLEKLIHGLRGSFQLDSVTLILHDPTHEIRQLLAGDGFLLEKLTEEQFVEELATNAPSLSLLDRFRL